MSKSEDFIDEDQWWSNEVNFLMDELPNSVKKMIKNRILNTKIKGIKYSLDSCSDGFKQFLREQIVIYNNKRDSIIVNNSLVKERIDKMNKTIEEKEQEISKKQDEINQLKLLLERQHKVIEILKTNSLMNDLSKKTKKRR